MACFGFTRWRGVLNQGNCHSTLSFVRAGIYIYTMNRIDRLSAMLIHLQSKRIVKAEEMADRFEISLRTVYRDVRALMEAGVPIGSEAGKGYFIVDGFHLPPVMFSQDEASALLLAGKLVEKMTDRSVRAAFESALVKIKSVLKDPEKDRLEYLHAHIEVWRREHESQPDFPNRFLTDIQQSVVKKEILEMDYQASYRDDCTSRMVEPIGLFYYGSAWHLIAWCHLRNDYRDFRADRIKELHHTGKPFANQNLLSLQEYLNTITRHHDDMQKVAVLFDKEAARYVGEQKYMHGFVTEEETGDKVRITFLTRYLHGLARWLLGYGRYAIIEHPQGLRDIMTSMIEELHAHYMVQSESGSESGGF